MAPTDAGWEALERGDWSAAAERLDAALASGPDDPRALEGRAWAAWWLDDHATLFDLRERAFHAHRRLGDDVGAARVAIWLGCDNHEIRGAHAVANGWYRRAQRLLAGHPTGEEHGWLAFQLGAYAIELADDAATARARAREVSRIADELGLFDLAMLSLALDGLALVTQGRVDEGMPLLDEASVAATSGEVRQRLAITWTLCYLIYACERARDFDRTAQWCRRMREVADRLGFAAGVGICRVHYGGVLLHHGSWAAADEELCRSREVLASVRPVAVAESDARLGELRRRQGRGDEARQLLLGALPHPVAALGLAALALDEARPDEALALADDVLAATPEASATQRADALAVRATALAALGDVAGAGEVAATLEGIAGRVGNRALAALAAEARGAAALAGQDLPVARRCLAVAADGYDASAMPYEAARVRQRLAAALVAAGRPDLAEVEAARASRALVALGAADRPAATPPVAPDLAVLTPREREVLALLARGLRDREIAEELTLSPHTVHRHVSNILMKLALPSRTAAAAHAVRMLG